MRRTAGRLGVSGCLAVMGLLALAALPQSRTEMPSTHARAAGHVAAPGTQLYVSSNGASFSDWGHGKVTEYDLDTFLSAYITVKQPVVERLDNPRDGACGPDGDVYFVDRKRGTVFRAHGRRPEVIAEVPSPEAVTFDANGDLYVSAADGIYRVPDGERTDRAEQVIEHGFGQPGGLGFLTDGPYDGDLLAVDIADDVVWRFPRSSTYSASFGEAQRFIDRGLDAPTGIALDSHGDVYVANFDSKRILRFEPNGRSVGMVGADVDLRLLRPIHLEFDRNDNLFVAEWGDYVGEGWVAMFSLASGEFRFMGPLVDAWGVALCPAR